jgi:uncharacterized protein YprB with RNaseH-like and TPR domain
MLQSTFVHLQGVGPATEKRLWQAGIKDWDDFLQTVEVPFGPARQDYIARQLRLAAEHLTDDPHFFIDRLPGHQHWRLFPHFRHTTAYLDIETTGLDGLISRITTITLYDGNSIRCYVQGENLDDVLDDLRNYKVLVTYNGKCFDVPFIERYFGVTLHQAHIDLRYIMRNLGYSGGLKGCEKQLGLDRGPLDGVDGYVAVLLWYAYQHTADRRILETLLAYNIQDTVNLETLMVEAYNQNVAKTPFADCMRLPAPCPPQSPLVADPAIVAHVKRMYQNYSV